MRSWKKKALAAGLFLAVFVTVVAAIQASQTQLLVLSALGKDAVGFNGITLEQVREMEEQLGKEGLKAVRSARELEVRASLGCSNVDPAVRIPGRTCIEGLLYSGENWSPVPEDRAWLLGVWMAAGKRYGIPWQLLAAISGTRSGFGRENCPSVFGLGPYRFPERLWKRYGSEAGTTRLSREGLCWRSEQPVRIAGSMRKPARSLKAPAGGSPHDWVDSTFSTARALAASGAWKIGKWDYSGSPPDACTTDQAEGPIWYPPEPPTELPPGSLLGFNRKLEIPLWAKKTALKYVSKTGKYRPRRSGLPLDERLGYHPMPKEDIVRLLEVAWRAFGVRGQELVSNVTKNYAQVGRESGGRPYILQGYIGDVNDNNPAGGLFQFIPSTFEHWKVDGFNNRFNPLDNILAAVNAQVNGPYYILDGSLGWSPPLSDNPYSEGGMVKIIDELQGPGQVDLEPYRGLPQTDEISRAVARSVGGASPCYVAIVHDWYKQIVENPPSRPISVEGPGGTRRDTSRGRIVPCPKEIPHDDSNPCMVDNRIIPNLLWIHRKFGIYISDGFSGPLPDGSGSAGCYASGVQCHSIDGEHPLGVGVDIIPVPGKDWNGIDRLAAWAEPEQNAPRPPFRWVGYDGDYNHGSGDHLHLSWDHSTPAIPYQIVDWVLVFGGGKKLGEEVQEPFFPKGDKNGGARPTGRIVRGRVSWFIGSMTASGNVADTTAGVALNLRPGTDASGWDNETTDRWMISAMEGKPYYARITIQGRSIVVPIIDKGPHEDTDRAIDLTLKAVQKMGWTGTSFPTDAIGTAEILGPRRK